MTSQKDPGAEPAEAADTAESTTEAAAEPEGEAAAAPEAAGAEAEMKAALAAAEDRYVRLYAEFENYKKRTGRENEDFRKYANEKVLREMLPVLDNLERAITHVREAPEEGTGRLLEGVELIRKQFADVLGRFDVTPIPALGTPFDPSVHQAVSQAESADAKAGTVIEELQRGFFYKERVLRPAMVVVARGASGEGN